MTPQDIASYLLLAMATLTGVVLCLALLMGIVAAARRCALRPVPEPTPPASWLAKMERGE